MALSAAILLLLWPKPAEIAPPGKDPRPGASPAQGTSPGATEETKPKEEKRRNLVAAIESMLNTPIVFYGRVVDQNGAPVPGATVRYSLLDKFNASGSGGGTVSDEAGKIEINGVKGAVLGVNVSKDGYYQIHNVSNQRFAYGYGSDGITKPPPTKEDPAVFFLHKMGESEPLVKLEKCSLQIPKDGTPVIVDIKTGRASITGQVRVESWTDDSVKDERKRYDWRCRLSVPSGGLIERNGQFEFEAPSDGYREYDEMVMNRDDPQWDKRFEKEYFLRLPDNTYARIKFSFTSAGEHYFRIESYLNPKSGSRNLEFDPAKRIKP